MEKILFLTLLLYLATTTAITSNSYDISTQRIKSDVSNEISKRDAVVPIIEGFPIDQYSDKKKIFIRKISKQRYNGPRRFKPSPQGRAKPHPREPKRRPNSNKRGKSPSKYGTPRSKYPTLPPNVFKKQTLKNKSKYGSRAQKQRTNYANKPAKFKSQPYPNGNSKPQYLSYKPSSPAGFGEPPSIPEYLNMRRPDHNSIVDSYGTQIVTTPEPQNDLKAYGTGDDLDLEHHYESHQYSTGSDTAPNLIRLTDQEQEQMFYSHHPKKNPPFLIEHSHMDNIYPDYFGIDTYQDLAMKHKEAELNLRKPNVEKHRKKKPVQLLSNKLLNKPWKASIREESNQYLVGGQYAEPPGRFVPKEPDFANKFFRGEDYRPQPGYIDPDTAESVTTSPYVNYKNGNIAFSPQNLNDAFSIVTK